MKHPIPAPSPRPGHLPTAFTAGLALALVIPLLANASAAPPPRAEAAPDGDTMRVRATLLTSFEEAGRARLGVLFELDPHWHIYWRNPGDIGLPPRFDWEVTPAAVGPVAWPLPQRFLDTEIDMVSYGYEDSVLLAAPVRWNPEGPAPQRAQVRVEFLACHEQCIPGAVSLSLPFPTAPDPVASATFERWARQVPVRAEHAGVEIGLDAPVVQDAHDRISFTLDVDACAGQDECNAQPSGAEGLFLPDSDDTLGRVTSHVSGAPTHGSFRLRLAADLLDPSAGSGHLRGVLLLEEASTRRGIRIDVPWRVRTAAPDLGTAGGAPASAFPASSAPGTPPLTDTGLLRAVLLAFLGGLILNLMPCVLPVLALKVFALTDLASRSRREVVAHAASYTGGILLAMGVLAALVIGLRAAGSAVGWGFHLQEPVFVVAICILLVAFALNLFGVFEIAVDTAGLAAVGSDHTGNLRSFFDGLLAVVLATPCSAPFLGTAVGFAFASSGLVITSIFGAIGIGLAAPFLAVAAVPALGSRMPRSGPWMLHLRAGLGFTLLASSTWLLWVLGRASGADAMAGALVLLVVVALGLWAFGLLQRLGRPLPRPALLGVLGLALMGGTGVVDFRTDPHAPSRGPSTRPGVTAWSSAAVQQTLREGRPAFVYFTADWCITCKVNESRVLEDPRVQQAFTRLDIPVFRADWTRRDETIRGTLATLGKAGVPAYVLYQPQNPDTPRVLPELLSVKSLLESLEQARPPAQARVRRSPPLATPGILEARS